MYDISVFTVAALKFKEGSLALLSVATTTDFWKLLYLLNGKKERRPPLKNKQESSYYSGMQNVDDLVEESYLEA